MKIKAVSFETSTLQMDTGETFSFTHAGRKGPDGFDLYAFGKNTRTVLEPLKGEVTPTGLKHTDHANFKHDFEVRGYFTFAKNQRGDSQFNIVSAAGNVLETTRVAAKNDDGTGAIVGQNIDFGASSLV